MRVERTEGEPHDPATAVANAMLGAGDPDAKAIVMVTLDNGAAGIALHGFENDTEAMVYMLEHLRAIFKANGKEFAVHTIGKG